MVTVEVESKYDVDPDAQVPGLSALVAGSTQGQSQQQLLDATYWDTPDQRLRAAGMTLRNRSGGTDAGWHLKLPAGDDREELRVQGPSDQVPAELAGLVRSRVRQQRLVPVARVTTRRTVHPLVGNDGVVLAELADDHVVGSALTGSAGEQAWREWEFELVRGERYLLGAAQQLLVAAGARVASHGSKVARALGPRPPRTALRAWWASAPGARRPTAGSLIHAHLREQVDELVSRDPQVRRDLPDAVHKMRVAIRRLRSALWTFGPLLEDAHTRPIRGELAWLARVLGAARDVEVMHARLRDLVAGEPTELVLGPVLRRVDLVMTGRYRTAHDRVLAELDGERYVALLDRLDEIAAAPPFLPRAQETAVRVLPPLVRRAWRRLDRAMDAVDAAAASATGAGSATGVTGAGRSAGGTTAGTPDVLLHEVRKHAKCARYAAEAVEPAFGQDARRFAAAMASLQEVLGDHQDGVVTKDLLREFGALAFLAGENGFSFGRLHALEQAKAEAAVRRWPQVRAQSTGRKMRRWFD